MQYIHIFFCFLTCSSDQAPNPECKRSVNFEISFWYLQFSQVTNKKTQLYYYGTSSRTVFVRYLGELKTPKRNFEIN